MHSDVCTTTAPLVETRLSTVCVVEGDGPARERLLRILQLEGLTARAYESASEFLQAEETMAEVGCLVMGIDGPDEPAIRSQLRTGGIDTPAVFLADHGNVSTATCAMKAGAVDFFLKPFEDVELIDAVFRALEQGRRQKLRCAARDALLSRIGRLTPREREVMGLVVSGLPNKLTAARLGIREATVKLHRHRVMGKMGVQSVAQLVRMLFASPDSTTVALWEATPPV